MDANPSLQLDFPLSIGTDFEIPLKYGRLGIGIRFIYDFTLGKDRGYMVYARPKVPDALRTTVATYKGGVYNVCYGQPGIGITISYR